MYMTDQRFVDQQGRICYLITILDNATVIALEKGNGKFFVTTLHEWNETWASLMCDEGKKRIQERLVK